MRSHLVCRASFAPLCGNSSASFQLWFKGTLEYTRIKEGTFCYRSTLGRRFVSRHGLAEQLPSWV